MSGCIWFHDENGDKKGAHLSDGIGFEKDAFGRVAFFGSTPAEAPFLGGGFIAARRSIPPNEGARFDKPFDFRFCDLDFPRGVFSFIDCPRHNSCRRGARHDFSPKTDSFLK